MVIQKECKANEELGKQVLMMMILLLGIDYWQLTGL